MSCLLLFILDAFSTEFKAGSIYPFRVDYSDGMLQLGVDGASLFLLEATSVVSVISHLNH